MTAEVSASLLPHVLLMIKPSPLGSMTAEGLTTVRPSVILPNEIVGMILDYVGDDKPTLAKCMRTSLQMNLIAAPRLYTRLRWGNGLAFPLAFPHPCPESIPSRLSPSKSDNLELVLELHLGNHQASICPPCSLDGLRSSQPHRLLHVPILSYKAHSRGFNWHAKDNHIDSSSSRCAVLSCIAPTKLVVHASYWEPLPIRSIDQRNLREIVSWIDLSYPSSGSGLKREQKPQPFGQSTSNKKTVVYIISDMAPDGENDQYSKYPIDVFCQHLMEVIYKRRFATEILIVNGAGRAQESARDFIYSCEERFRNMETDIRLAKKEQLERLESFWETRWTEGTGGTPSYKTMEEAEATTIHFLDSREYLQSYNTPGELTDEERIWYMGKNKDERQEVPEYRWRKDRRDVPCSSNQ